MNPSTASLFSASSIASTPETLTRRTCIAAGMLAIPTLALAVRPTVPLVLAEGIDVAFAESLLGLIANEARLQWALKYVPFSRLLLMAEQGQALAFGIEHSPERDAKLAFSSKVFSSRVWAISRRKLDLDLHRLDDLKGRRVCMVRSLNYGLGPEASKTTDFEVAYTTGDLSNRLRLLQAGRCDVLLTTHRNADSKILEQRVQDAGGNLSLLAVSKNALVEQGVHIAVARSSEWAKYLPQIDTALRQRREQINELSDGAVAIRRAAE